MMNICTTAITQLMTNLLATIWRHFIFILWSDICSFSFVFFDFKKRYKFGFCNVPTKNITDDIMNNEHNKRNYFPDTQKNKKCLGNHSTRGCFIKTDSHVAITGCYLFHICTRTEANSSISRIYFNSQILKAAG